MSAPLATIAICTHQRSTALAPCLDHLWRQVEGWTGIEVLVIDNASRDDTIAVAVDAITRAPCPARVVSEPALGLSNARNRAIDETQGDLLIYLDDDAFPHPGWLGALLQAFDDPAVEAAGGPIDPRFDGPLPDWLGPSYLPYLSAWDRGPEPHALTYNEYPRGANLALRRVVFDRIGRFSPHLGRRGTRLASCEEIELCLRVERTGGTVLYAPGARIDHAVPTARLDAWWMARRFHWQGRSEAVLEKLHGGWRAVFAHLGRQRRSWLAARAQPDVLAVALRRAALIGSVRGVADAVGVTPLQIAQETRLPIPMNR